MIKLIKNFVFIFIFALLLSCDQSLKSKNSSGKLVIVKVFSSLTCPHCADFHNKIFKDLEKDFITKGLVKFEHKSFPLDMAALNAEKILQCGGGSELNTQLLGEIYKKQNKWAVGSDINIINESIKKIGINFGLNNAQMNKCLLDKKLEDKILDERVEAQKNYKISSTPTIYVNEKKYEDKKNYKAFKKFIENLL